VESDEIKQEIRNMLNDMWDMSDHTMYSIALVREMLESLLAEGCEEIEMDRGTKRKAQGTMQRRQNKR
jgi:hypothetical protein